jgi:hypothetical protein
MRTAPKPGEPHVKCLVVFQGKGTPFEKRIETGVRLYWVDSMRRWCSIPD